VISGSEGGGRVYQSKKSLGIEWPTKGRAENTLDPEKSDPGTDYIPFPCVAPVYSSV